MHKFSKIINKKQKIIKCERNLWFDNLTLKHEDQFYCLFIYCSNLLYSMVYNSKLIISFFTCTFQTIQKSNENNQID